jgi:hypothetical protein
MIPRCEKDMPTGPTVLHETYCTFCKENVTLTGSVYLKLANGRAIIKGKCPRCGLGLMKASIKPKSSTLILLRKKKRRSKRSLRFV